MLSKIDVKPQQLSSYLESLATQKATGTLHITTESTSQNPKKFYVFIWKQGQITYAGREIPLTQDFVKNIVQKFKPGIVNVAISFLNSHVTQADSIRHQLELLVSIKIFTWEQIEELMLIKILVLLEEILTLNVQIVFEKIVNFDLCYGDDRHGFLWSKLQLELSTRQQKWQKLDNIISSSSVVPTIVNDSLMKIADSNIRKHLQEWVDGQRTVAEIAIALDKDSLQIARTYSNWVSAGWIICQNNPQNNILLTNINLPVVEKKLPKILSVDDSRVIQTMIKRALVDNYEVVCVNDSKTALENIKKYKFDLVLLDVTMPDIDGLELCKMIRNISRELAAMPIIMLTARDKFSDKFKGYAAGTTDYLTKPFDAEDLNRVLEKYLKE